MSHQSKLIQFLVGNVFCLFVLFFLGKLVNFSFSDLITTKRGTCLKTDAETGINSPPYSSSTLHKPAFVGAAVALAKR